MADLRRILYVGQFEPYMQSGILPTVASRFEGLQRLGLNIIPFDSTPYKGEGLWTRRLNQRFYAGSSVRGRNGALLEAARAERPDLIWVDKGYWIYPRTLARLRQYARYLVHYNTDDIYARQSYAWLHRAGAELYDLHLSTNRNNVQEIRERYGRPAMRAGMGHDATVHRRVSRSNCGQAVRHPIVFIGHWEAHYEESIRALQDAGLCVSVWGARWWRASNSAFRSVSILPGASYVSVLAEAKIALCLLSRKNRNESTGRSFEIPAIGTFMLAERTMEHDYLYRDGVGAALFGNAEELVHKARYYLGHSDERLNVAAAGHDRCIRLGLSWQDHMRREWPLVEMILRSGLEKLPVDADEPFWRGFRTGALPSGAAVASRWDKHVTSAVRPGYA